ncbi:NDMA-dependent alcohol dehydrogenase [Frankia sp. CNm7]|uniref:NDMA-dependent alcohol dehydrogenase n=1 Tax=Frankia nepalensis TaxID=1836974 RepID=A0A937UND4_9ACTN|nr:NDMA-dependent alcohol dehydrogenase [Frankia nepalensis]MBL7497971.1 NDMA-dependent alcohol dehydrogenase [Frankia nepalensis]MBL7509052.1 NDMA-dependent alcohol dehydrogenase [Frankia nepalensis]MBL7516845.1 NDMA-dependent alcohol dehydrogenase [Frankia nepalensis]MBL7627842.1 NDMA-dependent alcohol dehydrogenase [Frankia nepalensis]
MRTRAGVCWETGAKWSVEEVELDEPKAGEVLVRLAASGLCHSDDHAVTGDMPAGLPMVGGHEGAGVVEAVGPGVTSVAPGDHVVLTFVPACGRCRWCMSGMANLCDVGAKILGGLPMDGTHRTHARGQGLTRMTGLGTFSPHTVVHEYSVVKIDQDVPLELAALVGCGVATGFGSAINTAEVGPGDTVVVVGVGGVGAAAIQGARVAGAEHIVAVDPVAWKLDQAKVFGATHGVASMEEAVPLLVDLTRGVLADKAILTVGVAHGQMVGPLLALIRKGGIAVVTAVAPWTETDANLSLFELAIWQKQLRGSLFGGYAPAVAVPQLLKLYRRGLLRLDDLVTRRYSLDDLQQGYDDMHAGRNIRGLVVFD